MATTVRVVRNTFPDIARALIPAIDDVVAEAAEHLSAVISRTATAPVSPQVRKLGVARRGILLVWWWYFVEYGTRSQPARPALRPALEAERARFQRELELVFRQ